MNVSQNLAAIFNSPQWAEVNLQAVQAGDMAARQFEEARRREALRREHQVTGSATSDASQAVDEREGGSQSGPAARRPSRRAGRPARSPRPGPESGGPGPEAADWEPPTVAPGHVDVVA